MENSILPPSDAPKLLVDRIIDSLSDHYGITAENDGVQVEQSAEMITALTSVLGSIIKNLCCHDPGASANLAGEVSKILTEKVSGTNQN